MKFVDTHSHIYSEEFDIDRADCIQRAINEGVEKIFLPNVDCQSLESLWKTVHDFPTICMPLMALHPTSVKGNFEDELAIIEKELIRDKVYGIGETGIDLYWDKTYLIQQIESFERHIDWALQKRLPLIIHTRNSFNEVFEVLERKFNPLLNGIFHCFSGNLHQAIHCTELGFKLGIGGVVTYKNSGLDYVIKEMALEHFVLETDAPYLAPIPKRGKRNESSFLIHVAKKIAELKNCTLDEVANVTSQNAKIIFDF